MNRRSFFRTLGACTASLPFIPSFLQPKAKGNYIAPEVVAEKLSDTNAVVKLTRHESIIYKMIIDQNTVDIDGSEYRTPAIVNNVPRPCFAQYRVSLAGNPNVPDRVTALDFAFPQHKIAVDLKYWNSPCIHLIEDKFRIFKDMEGWNVLELSHYSIDNERQEVIKALQAFFDRFGVNRDVMDKVAGLNK